MRADTWLSDSADFTPVYIVTTPSELGEYLSANPTWKSWLDSTGFDLKAGSISCVPGTSGALAAVLAVADPSTTESLFSNLPSKLPAGIYQLDASGCVATQAEYQEAMFLIAQSAYRYHLDADDAEPTAQWVIPASIESNTLCLEIDAMCLARDLINTPPNYMQPPDLFLATKELCDSYDASLTTIQGRDLLTAGYEATYRVGQVGTEPPCMLDFTWGEKSHPLVTLIGKGVCFDSGGLCLKSAKGMLTMKKDMGGAAHVLGLAKMIMGNALPIRLRVIIPAVENGTGKGAYRPGDVLRYADGTTVEITNTDAEGRLILADALLAACADEKPDCLVDFATLTGAARVAVGMDVAAFFTPQEDQIAPFMENTKSFTDPIWPLPLVASYKKGLKSHVADLANAAMNPYGGAITAALYLQHFVPEGVNWWHFDVSGWADAPNPGAAVTGIRSMYAWLLAKYGN